MESAGLVMCPYMAEGGRRGVGVTLSRLRQYTVSSGMETTAQELVRKYLYHANSRSTESWFYDHGQSYDTELARRIWA